MQRATFGKPVHAAGIHDKAIDGTSEAQGADITRVARDTASVPAHVLRWHVLVGAAQRTAQPQALPQQGVEVCSSWQRRWLQWRHGSASSGMRPHLHADCSECAVYTMNTSTHQLQDHRAWIGSKPANSAKPVCIAERSNSVIVETSSVCSATGGDGADSNSRRN